MKYGVEMRGKFTILCASWMLLAMIFLNAVEMHASTTVALWGNDGDT